MKLKYQILLSLLYFVCDVTQAQNTSANTRQEILGDTLPFHFGLTVKTLFHTLFPCTKLASFI